MIELRLALSIGAIRAMTQGEELALDIEGEGIRVILRCDDDAVSTVKEQVERALLHMLPTDPHRH